MSFSQLHTGIIATIGPASFEPSQMQNLINAGASAFRLNFSHGEHSWHKTAIKNIRSVDSAVPIILDTKGPEMRTGDIEKPMKLKKDEWLTLVIHKEDQDIKKNKLFVNHSGIINDVAEGDRLSLNSGFIELEVLEVQEKAVITRVLHSGKIRSRRHLNLIEKDISLPTLSDIDVADIMFGLENGVSMLALSFVRSSTGIIKAKECIAKSGRNDVLVIAKIESQKGIDNIEEIAEHADALMVARGDLGVETPLELIPQKQKQIIEVGKKHDIPVVVATEMLESMTQKPRPTRAEVSDIALAVEQGAAYTMLSAETAAGKYPVESVQIMKRIIDATETYL